MSGFSLDPALHGLKAVLDLRAQQHSLTAANLANADTPGYRAKVLDFEHALGDAMRAVERGVDPAEAARAEIVEIEPPPWVQDGNSVFAERETARLAENALLYRGVAKGVSRRLALLKYAASDGRG